MNKEKIKETIKDLNKSFLIGLLSITPLIISFWIFGLFYEYIKIGITFVFSFGESKTFSIFVFWAVFLIITFIGLKIRNLEKIFLLSSIEDILSKIPLIGFVIKTGKEIVKIFSQDGTNGENSKYLGVVKAPFNNGKTLGLITAIDLHTNEYTVFIPTAPNPTSGFVMYYKEEELEKMDLSISEVFKIQLSLGVKTED